MKAYIINYLLKKYADKLWVMSGDIAGRFHEKDSGDYDDLQEKLNSWITEGIRQF